MGRKVIQKFGQTVEFGEFGMVVEGIPLKITQGNTKFGEAEFLQLEDQETGELKSVCLSANLKGHDWEEMIAAKNPIGIEYIEDGYNAVTKRNYKIFEVYEVTPD